ncbi:POTRA domain-containing protein [Terracidiphilus gabretensis]|jgi:outer membrane protein assembly factor BamA|uniref:POTRA domain-containing protein n=1 Tax=Terracidiphilus gabretensis TaxID=1577687 RepID=UPI00071BF6C7|nr:POTRA domain-containing protein [Terracidiphilus gabretensis]
MRLTIPAFLAALAAACLALPLSAQKFTPKTIQFQGAPDYANDDLLAAAGIKAGQTLSSDDMQQRMNALSQSGLFDSVKFTFNGQDLVFQLKPASQLYSVRLDNLPLTPGPDLDAKIRAKLPLYHGKVPSDGTLLDGVQSALEEQLAAIGIKATITSAPYSAMGAREATAIAFHVTTPQILIGEIQPGVAPQLTPKAQAVLASLTGLPYSTEGSTSGIARDLLGIYRDMGYLDVKADAAKQPTLIIAPDIVKVPFRYSLDAGALYKVTAIQLAPDMLVSQADFDKQSHVHPGDPADAEHISQNWHFIERQYHNRGYARARITPAATLDHAQHTVSYAVTAEPGAMYTMGKISVENVSDEIRTMMLAAWKLPAGAVFNESALLSYFAIDATNTHADPRLFKLFQSVNYKYTLNVNDDTKTVDVVLRLEKRTS